jgi:hypothetical protein
MLRFVSTSARAGLVATLILAYSAPAVQAAEQAGVVYQGRQGPGVGKHIVLVSGDEEYRSEEMLPQLAKILAQHHGFKCTVLFAIDPADGTINPDKNDNIPGLEALDSADLLIQFIRWRNLPDEQLRHFADYFESGKPMIGIRTGTHPFKIDRPDSKYKHFTYNSTEWDGGVGRQVFGETWKSHHGKHKYESQRGVIAPGMEGHPIARGIGRNSLWGPTDVYGVTLPLPGDSQPIVLGQVLEGMFPDDQPVEGPQNDPLMPIAWTKTYTGKAGKTARVFTSTMGSADDLESEGYRRLLVNATYWCLGLENWINPTASVALVGDYQPTPFGATPRDRSKSDGAPYKSGQFRRGVKPADLAVEGLTP